MNEQPIDHFKGLPRRVHIGQYVFRLLVVPNDDAALEGCDGMTYAGTNKIYLARDVSLQTALNTAVHELTHAVNWVRDVTDGAEEEVFTTQHTYGVVELWLRNPRVFNWINKQLRTLRKEASRD